MKLGIAYPVLKSNHYNTLHICSGETSDAEDKPKVNGDAKESSGEDKADEGAKKDKEKAGSESPERKSR